jgi:hypothetical protein
MFIAIQRLTLVFRKAAYAPTGRLSQPWGSTLGRSSEPGGVWWDASLDDIVK